MATIKINNTTEIKGRVSFEHSIYFDKEANEWKDGGISGTLITHKYVDDISSIETDRYIIDGCTVHTESFGSDDFNIVYQFIADSCTVKPDTLPDEEIQKIEDEKYAYEKTDKFLYGITNED